MANKSSLTIELKPGEALTLSGEVTVELLRKSGRLARLKVTAPQDVLIGKKTSEGPEKAQFGRECEPV